ncbi:MAG: ComEC/Rec2 family competence protein [Microgenomates group bacterium]
MLYRFSFWFVVILLIFIRFYFNQSTFKNGDFIRITSKIYSEPIVFERQQYLKLQGLKVYLPKYPEVSYGDIVAVTGTVNGGKLKNPKLEKILEDKNWIYSFREKIIKFYKNTLPEPYSSLVAGIVLGSKQMPQEFWEKLKATGTAHVVVASGTNVTMVATFLISSLTFYFKRRTAVFMSIAGIFFYVILSGFDAPIVRAAIMGSIVFLGQEKGRVVNTWRILIYSAVLMLLIKPDWINDLGFLLSFVATMSLIIFQKRINDKLMYIPTFLREGLSTSLAAQIGVFPIIFVTFGQFNILSPIINALILWTIPYIMIFGSVSGVVGQIVPIFGRLLLLTIYPLLWYFEKILSIF